MQKANHLHLWGVIMQSCLPIFRRHDIDRDNMWIRISNAKRCDQLRVEFC